MHSSFSHHISQLISVNTGGSPSLPPRVKLISNFSKRFQIHGHPVTEAKMSQISGTAPMPGAVNLLKYFLSLCERFYSLSSNICLLETFKNFSFISGLSLTPFSRLTRILLDNTLLSRLMSFTWDIKRREEEGDCMVDGGELVWLWSESPVKMSLPSMWVIVRPSVPVSLVNR